MRRVLALAVSAAIAAATGSPAPAAAREPSAPSAAAPSWAAPTAALAPPAPGELIQLDRPKPDTVRALADSLEARVAELPAPRADSLAALDYPARLPIDQDPVGDVSVPDIDIYLHRISINRGLVELSLYTAGGTDPRSPQ